jgi:hypothetical protein
MTFAMRQIFARRWILSTDTRFRSASPQRLDGHIRADLPSFGICSDAVGMALLQDIGNF